MSSDKRVVHFIRHAQSTFNKAHRASFHGQAVDLDSTTLIDADLSEEGRQQAIDAKPRIASLNIDLAITSPFARAISTCLLANGYNNVLVTPLCSERFEAICDIGTPRKQLIERYPKLDFSLVEDNIWWFNPDGCQDVESVVRWYKSPKKELEHEPILKSRAERFYRFLRSRQEKNIAVFSHSYFLRMFLHWHFGREKMYIDNAEVVSYPLP